MKVVIENLPYFLRGLAGTIQISLLTFGISTALSGLTVLIVQILDNRKIETLITVIVNLIRGLPLLVILFMTYFWLPFMGLHINRLLAATLGLSVFFAASIYEVLRGGIQSVELEQAEAATALAMTRWQILTHIIFPQAARRLVGPLLGEFVRIVKGSTLLSLLTIPELMLAGREAVEATFMGTQIYLTIGFMYFGFIYSISLIAKKLEAKFYYHY